MGKNVYFTFPVYHKRVACHSFEYVSENRCLFRIIKSNIRIKIPMNEYRPIWMWCVLTRGFYLYSFVITWYVLTLQRKIQRIWYQKRGDLHLPLCLCFDESLLFSTPDIVVLEDTLQASNYPGKVRVSTPHRSELWMFSLPKHDIYNSFFPQQRRVSFQ